MKTESIDDGTGCGSLYRWGAGDRGAQAANLQPGRARMQGGRALSVTIHDVAPATQARCEQLIAHLASTRAAAGPLTLLVVPYYHHRTSTAAFERWIEARLRRGDELALHGLTHLDDAGPPVGWIDHLRRHVYTAGEGEFAALGRAAARARLEAGRYWFAQRGWPLRGFVPPAWLLGAGAWSALCEQPLDYTCTLTELIALPARAGTLRALRGWSIVFSTRTPWRRATSLAWNRALARTQCAACWMRFELHPADVEHAAVRTSIAGLLERAYAGERAPLTLGGIVDRFD